MLAVRCPIRISGGMKCSLKYDFIFFLLDNRLAEISSLELATVSFIRVDIQVPGE